MSKRVFLSISYFGGAFYGSQRQKNLFTAQKCIEEALTEIYKTDIKVSCCSRLDKDVSALKWGVSYLEPNSISFYKLKYALNRAINPNMHINEIKYVNESFFPRRDAIKKTYLYSIHLLERNPLTDFTSFNPPFMKFDVDELIKSLDVFIGTHDFSSFSSHEDFKTESPFKTVDDIKCVKEGEYLKIYITGPSFLRYQVRFIVGSAYMVSLGKMSLDDIKSRLDGTNKTGLKYKAPGCGLTLFDVEYTNMNEESN